MNLLAWCPWPHQRSGRRAPWPARRSTQHPRPAFSGARHATASDCVHCWRRHRAVPWWRGCGPGATASRPGGRAALPARTGNARCVYAVRHGESGVLRPCLPLTAGSTLS